MEQTRATESFDKHVRYTLKIYKNPYYKRLEIGGPSHWPNMVIDTRTTKTYMINNDKIGWMILI